MTRSAQLRVSALVAAAALGVAGCSDPGGGTGETPDAGDDGTGGGTLVVQSAWTRGSAEGDALEAMIARFEDETGATVEWLDTGASLAEVYESSVAAGNQADVVLTNFVEKVVDWAKNGAVVPMADYLEEWGLAEVIRPEAVEQWHDSEGNLVGLPYSGFIWPVWYNTDLLSEAGVDDVPETTDELLEAVTKLQEAGITPMVIGGSDWSGQKLFLQVVQSYADPETAEAVFAEGEFCTEPSIRQGVELFAELRDAGLFVENAEGYSADAMNAEYYSGAAAIMSAGSWAFGETPQEVADATVLSGLPVPSDGPYSAPTAMQGYTGTGVLVSENGVEKIDLVQSFVEMFYSAESVAAFVSDANLVPAATSAADAEISSPLLQQAVSDLDDRVEYAVMPDTFVPGPVADPMIRATSAAFTRGTSVDDVCAAVQEAYDSAQ